MGKYKKIIFFDRDGVLTPSIEINKVPVPVYRIGQQLNKSIAEQIYLMKSLSKYFFFMVTNQPDISRGARSLEELNFENQFICNFFKLDDWEMCPHDHKDNCICKKPKVGMINKIMKRNHIQNDFIHTFIIGDRIVDIELAKNIGAIPLLIDHKYYENRDYNFKCKKFKSTIEALTYIHQIDL